MRASVSRTAARWVSIFVMSLLATIIMIITGCEDNVPALITNSGSIPDTTHLSSSFFPMANGDTWYYTNDNSQKITRTIAGDTSIGIGNPPFSYVSCKKVQENGITVEAWRLTQTAFEIHLIDRIYSPQPPLAIPFDTEINAPFSNMTHLYYQNGDSLQAAYFSESVVLKGFVSKLVPAGLFLKSAYFTHTPEFSDNYDEFYGNGIGLLSDFRLTLDSAYISGIWYR